MHVAAYSRLGAMCVLLNYYTKDNTNARQTYIEVENDGAVPLGTMIRGQCHPKWYTNQLRCSRVLYGITGHHPGLVSAHDTYNLGCQRQIWT